MEVKLSKINKWYKQLHVLKDIDLSMKEGIHGLVGPNGAGKSTMMKLMVGIETPTSGDILLDGDKVSPQKKEYKKKLGYLPQAFGFYKEFTGRELLRYTGLIKTDMNVDEIDEEAERLLTMMDLRDKADVNVAKYSGGMKQRLGIAQAFLGNPEIIILDEATVGLDPMQRINFKSFLKEYSKNRIILLSTHIMSDLQEIADDLFLLKEGRIVYQGDMDSSQDMDALYLKYFG